MDVAKKKDGDWIIMELGDGQVAGLPDNADRNEFYNNLKENALQLKPYKIKTILVRVSAYHEC